MALPPPVQSLSHTYPWSPLPAPRLIALFLLVFVSEALIFDINTEMLLIMMDEISRAHKRVSRQLAFSPLRLGLLL
jgi:hypothetical protein